MKFEFTPPNQWSYYFNDELIVFTLDGTILYYEGGPDSAARSHENWGGKIEINDFMNQLPMKWMNSYNGLYENLKKELLNFSIQNSDSNTHPKKG